MSQPEELSPEFFVDRSLGKSIVEGLRAAGLTVHSMADDFDRAHACQNHAGSPASNAQGDNSWLNPIFRIRS